MKNLTSEQWIKKNYPECTLSKGFSKELKKEVYQVIYQGKIIGESQLSSLAYFNAKVFLNSNK